MVSRAIEASDPGRSAVANDVSLVLVPVREWRLRVRLEPGSEDYLNLLLSLRFADGTDLWLGRVLASRALQRTRRVRLPRLPAAQAHEWTHLGEG
jgi:hypothetical protein